MDNAVYIVPQSVFFTASRDQVYVRNVDTRKNYLLSGSAYDILSILKTPHDLSSLVDRLKQDFSLEDESGLAADISSFVDTLLKEGLVQDVTKNDDASPDNRNNIEAIVRQQALNDNRLLSITLELTYRCNEHCVHCYLDDPSEKNQEKELLLGDWKRVIDECAALGCLSVLVTGGEPTKHPNFIDICRHVTSKGLLLNIYTNGLHVDDYVFNALCDIKLNSISVSLYSGKPEFHDSITGVPGSFDKTLMTAMKFKCAGKDTFIKTVVFRNHLEDYILLRKLGARLGMAVSPAPVITAGHSGKSNAGLVITDDEFRRLLHEDKSLGINCDCAEERDIEGPVCMAGQNMLSFDPYGNVFPCNAVQEPVGNVLNRSISDIWNNSEKLKWIRCIRLYDLSVSCSSCDSIKVCTCCLGAALTENGGKLGLFHPACRQTKIRHEAWKEDLVRECGLEKENHNKEQK